MTNIKVGDKVRYTGDNTPKWEGLEGEVTSLNPLTVTVSKEDAVIYGLSGGPVYFPFSSSVTVIKDEPEASAVNHPSHYGGDTTYEVIKVAEAWGLDKDAYLFNVLKYIARAGKKDEATLKQDLEKGDFYLKRRIGTL